MLLASVLLFALFLGSPAPQQKAVPATATVQVRPVPDEALRLNQRLAPKLSPSARSKVQSAATAVLATAKQEPSATPAQLQSKARAAVVAAFPGLASSDIDSVVFLVMMQAVQDQDADQQQTMNAMKQSTASKQAARYSPKNSKDSMSDISSMQQMQLQMAMDRKSKLLDTISNLEKKMADTSDLVVQNLK